MIRRATADDVEEVVAIIDFRYGVEAIRIAERPLAVDGSAPELGELARPRA